MHLSSVVARFTVNEVINRRSGRNGFQVTENALIRNYFREKMRPRENVAFRCSSRADLLRIFSELPNSTDCVVWWSAVPAPSTRNCGRLKTPADSSKML